MHFSAEIVFAGRSGGLASLTADGRKTGAKTFASSLEERGKKRKNEAARGAN